jgi:LysM repeat protein
MIPVNIRTAACLVILPAVLASCGSSPKIKGLPRKLPVIDLYGSAQTPAHSMEKKDYPFSPDGSYVTAWASEGSTSTSQSDFESWRSSHDGSVSRRNPSPVRKVSSSSSAKKKTAAKSSGRSGSYTIKKGDTLGAIAKRNGTTVAKIKAANGMSSDFIREGKALKIPK